jgi:amino acid adenylation domain-containing protein
VLRTIYDEATAEARLFWETEFASAPAASKLPPDYDFHGEPKWGVYAFKLDEATASGVWRMSNRNRFLIFSLLIAAVDVSLFGYNNERRILIASPPRRSDGNVPGLLPVLSTISGEMTFRSLCASVREKLIETYRHQGYPYEDLAPRGGLLDAPNGSGFGLSVSLAGFHEPMRGTASSIRISLQAERELLFEIEFNANRYLNSTIGLFALRLQRVFERVNLDAGCTVDDLIARAFDDTALLRAWSGEGKEEEWSGTVVEEIERVAERSGDRIAVECEGAQLSYGAMSGRSNQLARYLRGQGVGAEVRVGVCLRRSVDLVVAVLGVLKAGGAYVGMDPGLPAERLRFYLSDSGARMVLTERESAVDLAGTGARVVELAGEAAAMESGGGEPLGRGLEKRQLAFVIYTSGSSGRPKGVAGEHAQLCSYLQGMKSVLEGREQERYAMLHNLGVDAPLTFLFGALVWGGRLLLSGETEHGDSQRVVQWLAREQAELLKIAPSYLRVLLEEGSGERWLGRLVLVGGEASDGGLRAQVEERAPGCRYVNHYGPTETTCGVATYTAPEGGSGAGVLALGRPLSTARIYVADAELEWRACTVAGEICIGGGGVTRGYVGQPALTAERFVPDAFGRQAGGRLYRSGDRGRWGSNGELEFLGREDAQVKIRGVRIEPGEVEQRLRGHPEIVEAAVMGQAGAGGAMRLVAVVQGRREVGEAELRRHLQGFVLDQMLPDAYVWVERWPRTGQGKSDRQALQALAREAAAEAERGEEGQAAGPEEEQIAAVWREVLQREQIGRQQDFFAAGGHSLLATQVMSRIRRTLGVELPLRDLFEAPTVAGLAARLRQRRQETGEAVPPLVAEPGAETAPLSFAQQRLWFLDQLEPGSRAYHIPFALQLEGRLEIEALRTSLTGIVRRHAVLRTSFPAPEGEPQQRIAPAGAVPVPLIDLSACSGAEQIGRSLLGEEAAQPFNLAAGPLLRARVVRLSATRHVLLLTLHHILSDGWSTGVLVREWAAGYQAAVAHEEPAWAPLAVQYADYARWQRQWLRGEVLERHLEYWRRQLAGTPRLELPRQPLRAGQESLRGAVFSFQWEPSLTASLRQLSQRSAVTLFMTLLAGVQYVLGSYAQQSDVAVGTPIANRTRLETEALIGCFVNTLVLRTQLPAQASFAELLRSVKHTVLDAYAHQDAPFERVVEAVAPERDLARTPLFQVLFALHNLATPALDLPHLQIAPAHGDAEAIDAKVPLAWFLSERNNIIQGHLEYAADSFRLETIEQMAESLRFVLEQAVSHPERPLSKLQLLDDTQARRVVHALQGHQAALPQCSVLQTFAARCMQIPDRIAVTGSQRHITYGELDSRSNRLAHTLRRFVVRIEQPAAVCAARSEALIVALLAIMKAGGRYVPLDAASPQERLEYVLRDSGAVVVITDCEGATRIAGANIPILDIDSDLWAASALSEPFDSGIDLGQSAYSIYTSGSTGRPKGVVASHRNLAALVEWQLRHFYARPDATTLQFAPSGFDVSLQEIFGTLASGGRLVLLEEQIRREPDSVLALIRSEQVERLYLPFVALRMLAFACPDNQEAPDALREVISAGEQLRITPEMASFFSRRPGCVLRNQYGPTEASVICTDYLLAGDPTLWPAQPAIGQPIANTYFYILSATGNLLPPDAIGELHIGGASICRGYHARPDLTAERWRPDPWSTTPGSRIYRTGDLVRLRQDGDIEYLGRNDQQIKIRGYRVEPGEVEAAIEAHEAVSRCVVVSHPGAAGAQLVAYVVPDSSSGAALRENTEQEQISLLRDLCRRSLPDYLVPSAFVLLDGLPLNASGKIDHRSLPAPAAAWRSGEPVSRGPRDSTETLLAQVWKEILGVSEIGIRDNFFDAGGHSITAVALTARLSREYGRHIPVRALFEHPTIESFSRMLRQEVSLGLPSPLVPLRRGHQKLPLFCIHPAGGLVHCYVNLLQRLGADQALYAFRSEGLEDGSEPLRTVPEMAALYAEHMLSVQPNGPYRVMGLSMGACVAFETARQLKANGHAVSFVGILDGSYGGRAGNSTGEKADEELCAARQDYIRRYAEEELQIPPDEFGQLSFEEQLNAYLKGAQAAGRVPADITPSQFSRFLDVFMINVRAMNQYTPSHYDGRLTVFRTSASLPENDTLGWGRVCPDVDVHVFPGAHGSFLSEPVVETFAEMLIRHL